MGLSKDLLDMLACPKCKGDIRISKDEGFLVCDYCKLLYKIDDNIPVMLIDEALQVNDTSDY